MGTTVCNNFLLSKIIYKYKQRAIYSKLLPSLVTKMSINGSASEWDSKKALIQPG